MSQLNQYIAEIRFIPKPYFFDKRGQFIHTLMSKELQLWRLQDNRLELFNDDGLLFLSYSNVGFQVKNVSKLDVFINAFDTALGLIGDIPPVRWGYRVLAYKQDTKSYKTLTDEYLSKYLSFNKKHFTPLNGILSDIGLAYIFHEDHNKYHIKIGPMQKKQAETVFKGFSGIPTRGKFIDLDIFRSDDDFYAGDSTKTRVMDFIRNARSTSDKIIEGLI